MHTSINFMTNNKSYTKQCVTVQRIFSVRMMNIYYGSAILKAEINALHKMHNFHANNPKKHRIAPNFCSKKFRKRF